MKTLTTFSLMLALSVPVFANAQASEPGTDDGPACTCDGHGPRGQHRGPPDPARMQEHLNQRLERMTQELSLRPDQVQRIQSIMRDAIAQMRASRQARAQQGRGQQRPNAAQRRAHMQARFAVEERIAAVLDRDQLLRFLAMRHQHMLEGRGSRRGPGHGQGRGRGHRAGGQGRR